MTPFLAFLAQNNAAPVFGGIAIVFFLLAIVASIFWLWMLIDAIMNEHGTDKILWFLVIFFLHLLGALIYFIVRRNHRTPRVT
jgi:hypothetical protein